MQKTIPCSNFIKKAKLIFRPFILSMEKSPLHVAVILFGNIYNK